MILRLLQKHGHTPLVLLGGGTTTDRRSVRQGRKPGQMLTDGADRRATWPASAAASIRSCASATPRARAMLADNGTWLDGARLHPAAARRRHAHVTVNRMLTFNSVKLRLEREQPLTFLEFNYMILQSYDFRELSRRHGVRLQIGGSDQWGNIIAGIELTRRTDGKTVFGLTTPLITTASGAKMGKTARGAVWLTADRVCALRVLAVLAQHRRRRRGPLPAPVHRPAAGRDRAAGSAGRGRDQRGEESAGDRGDRARARPARGRGGGGDRAARVRGRGSGGGPALGRGAGGGSRGRSAGVPPVRAGRPGGKQLRRRGG